MMKKITKRDLVFDENRDWKIGDEVYVYLDSDKKWSQATITEKIPNGYYTVRLAKCGVRFTGYRDCDFGLLKSPKPKGGALS